MRKLAKKVLAICLSAVMAGTLLSATAFAAQSKAVSDNEYGIATLASAFVINEDQTETDWTVSGNVYIQKDVTLTLEGTTTISGNVYVFGTLRNNGTLTVTGTLHCLHYNNSMSASGNYDYGYFINSGYAKLNVLDVTSRWLDTEIPDTTDDGDDNDGDDDDSGTEIPSNIHVTVIDGEETFTDREITGDVIVPKDTTLTTSGNVSINGDVYVLGTLTNTGTLNISGTIYCLNYNSSLSAGDYDYGYVHNNGSMSAHTMIVKDTFLSMDFPTSTVHTWDSGEVVTKATCTEPGEVLYVCSGCGETKTEPIPAGHTWDENIEWTWSEDHSSATATRTCSVCGETDTVEATVESTKTEDGEIIYTATATFDDGTSITNSVSESDSTDTGTTGTGSTGTGTSGTGSSETGSTESNGTGSTGTGSTGSGSTGTGSSGSSGNSGSSGTGSTVTSPQTSDSTINTTALWLIVVCFGSAGCVALTLYKVCRTKE